MLNEKISKPYVLRRVKSIEVINSRALIDSYITSDEFFLCSFWRPFTKNKERIQKFKEIRDSR